MTRNSRIDASISVCMKALLITIVVAVLCACGEPPAYYVSGVPVYREAGGPSRVEMQAAVDRYLGGFADRGRCSSPQRCVRRLDAIRWEDDALGWRGHEAVAEGLHTCHGNRCEIRVHWRGSVRESAVWHELRHHALWLDEGDADPSHLDGGWYD